MPVAIPGLPRTATSIVDLIGNTPLIRLSAFEAGLRNVDKGIVRDAVVQARVCEEIVALIASLGWKVQGILPSPILGREGNREFLLGARRD